MLNINLQFFGGRGSGGGKSGGKSGGSANSGTSKNALGIEKEFPEFQGMKMVTYADGSKHGKADTGESPKSIYDNTTAIKSFKSDAKDSLKATVKSKSGDVEISVKNGTPAHREFSRAEYTNSRSVEVLSDYKVTGSDGKSYAVRTRRSQLRYDVKVQTDKEYIVSIYRKKGR